METPESVNIANLQKLRDYLAKLPPDYDKLEMQCYASGPKGMTNTTRAGVVA